MATDTGRSTTYRQRAANLIALRKFERAAQEARRALRLAPNDAHSTLALVLSSRGKRQEAREHHERAVALGRIHLARDEGDAAFAAFRKALRLDPSDEGFKRELVRAVEAKLPVIGVMWRYVQTSLSHRVFWTAVTLFSFVTCCLTGWTNPGLALLLGVFYLFDLVWGFFVWVVDPLVTRAALKGWIK